MLRKAEQEEEKSLVLLYHEATMSVRCLREIFFYLVDMLAFVIVTKRVP